MERLWLERTWKFWHTLKFEEKVNQGSNFYLFIGNNNNLTCPSMLGQTFNIFSTTSHAFWLRQCLLLNLVLIGDSLESIESLDCIVRIQLSWIVSFIVETYCTSSVLICNFLLLKKIKTIILFMCVCVCVCVCVSCVYKLYTCVLYTLTFLLTKGEEGLKGRDNRRERELPSMGPVICLCVNVQRCIDNSSGRFFLCLLRRDFKMLCTTVTTVRGGKMGGRGQKLV